MPWINVGTIKGDTGATGENGFSPYIAVDRVHGFIVLGDEDSEKMIFFSELKGPKGDTGPAGAADLTSTLDTTDTTHAVANSTIATAIEDMNNQIGSITNVQQSNLTLLGS